jgi:hypothetical protein
MNFSQYGKFKHPAVSEIFQGLIGLNTAKFAKSAKRCNKILYEVCGEFTIC